MVLGENFAGNGLPALRSQLCAGEAPEPEGLGLLHGHHQGGGVGVSEGLEFALREGGVFGFILMGVELGTEGFSLGPGPAADCGGQSQQADAGDDRPGDDGTFPVSSRAEGHSRDHQGQWVDHPAHPD